MGQSKMSICNIWKTAKQAIKAAVDSGASVEEIQQRVYEYRSGLQAREALYGRCPGRCLSYDFPVDFRNSAKVVAKNLRLDLLIDIPAVYYGADIVLKGPELLLRLRKSCLSNGSLSVEAGGSRGPGGETGVFVGFEMLCLCGGRPRSRGNNGGGNFRRNAKSSLEVML